MLRKRFFGDKNGGSSISLNLTKLQSVDSKSSSLKNLSGTFSLKHINEDKVKELTSEENKHDDLADELLRLTSTMKQNFTIAGSVIKEDNQVRLRNIKRYKNFVTSKMQLQ